MRGRAAVLLFALFVSRPTFFQGACYTPSHAPHHDSVGVSNFVAQIYYCLLGFIIIITGSLTEVPVPFTRLLLPPTESRTPPNTFPSFLPPSPLSLRL